MIIRKTGLGNAKLYTTIDIVPNLLIYKRNKKNESSCSTSTLKNNSNKPSEDYDERQVQSSKRNTIINQVKPLPDIIISYENEQRNISSLKKIGKPIHIATKSNINISVTSIATLSRVSF